LIQVVAVSVFYNSFDAAVVIGVYTKREAAPHLQWIL